jgi:hypothetical protein
MKWWQDYEHASDLYDAVQKHQQCFRRKMFYPNNGSYSIDFIYPRSFPTFTFQTWGYRIWIGDKDKSDDERQS